MSNIRFEFDVEVPVEQAYAALTEQAGIKGWWTTDTEIEAKEGTNARFGFGPKGEIVFTVAKLEENSHVRWNHQKAAAPDWGGTYVTFDLESTESGTKINFAHQNYATEEGSYAAVSWNWAYFLFSLKSYLETGTGTPVPAA